MKNIEELLSSMAYKANKELALELVFTSEIEETETWKKFINSNEYAGPKDAWVRIFKAMRFDELSGNQFPWGPGMTILDKWEYISGMRRACVVIKHFKKLAKKELEGFKKNGG